MAELGGDGATVNRLTTYGVMVAAPLLASEERRRRGKDDRGSEMDQSKKNKI